MARNLIFFCAVAALLLPILLPIMLADAGEVQSRAVVRTEGMVVKPITTGALKGKLRAEQAFRFALGERRYRVRYTVKLDPAQPDRAFPSEGYIGLPVPCSCNWYHSGFLFVIVNGHDIGPTKLHRGYVSESGSRAIADLVWDAPPAVVRIRFTGLPNDDKLLCEIALEPKEEIKSIALTLRCYPSFFTSWHKRNGDRKIMTPSATFNQGEKTGGPVEQHSYAVYYDTIFDVAKGEGDGPCAVMLSPEAMRTVQFDIGSYAVTTNIACDPQARSLRLAVWEFPKVANETVLTSFRERAAGWATDLRDFDFASSVVRSFDPKAELAELDRLSQPLEVRKTLGARADEYRERIEALAAPTGDIGILQQAELLSFLAEYREFLWELKLAALIAD